MKKISFVFTLFALLAASQEVQAVGPTYVRDAISVSTIWTPDGNPYIVQNDIVIAKGAVLTIAPGVQIQFAASDTGKVGAGPNLVVEGGLKAVGNSTSPISFGPSTAGQLWGAVYFYNSDPVNSVLQGCLIKGGRVVCNGSSPVITQCAIYGAKSGVEIAMNSQPQIMNNRITANGVGVILLADTASPVITGNQIYNNNYGFYVKDFGTPSISGNLIYSNLKYNVVQNCPKTLSFPNNDFRMVDAQQIARTIYDGAYNPSLGRVNYMPFVGMSATPYTQMAVAPAAQSGSQAAPQVQEEDFWSYGRPFDAMKVSNLDASNKKSSDSIKVVAVGATAVVAAVLLFL